ncbi:unnamed protein product [Didymodactylos carnosus]|uniref:Uncharacterized protein n=1 Tax=Didymodactylos carnosus TaxID=1234261 RepID=A0A815EP64_9BILA|nr:unnamed protein product [Didymodactylos carnosus]CAF1312631.1 unnamed protein product [Didymodactylos carnosus]CAF4085491.1 unnamed protein product [Didymodactylos carnosus]CAF4151624.1 unnamed protein product [Didymodactylos carnosus]
MANYISNDVDFLPSNTTNNTKIVDVDDRFLDMSQHLYYQYHHSGSRMIPSTISSSTTTLSSSTGGGTYTRKNKLRTRLHHLINGDKIQKRSLSTGSSSNLSVPTPSLATKFPLPTHQDNNNRINHKTAPTNVGLTSPLVAQTPVNSRKVEQQESVHLVSTFQPSAVYYQHQKNLQVQNSYNGSDRNSDHDDDEEEEEEVTITRL